MCNYYYIIFTSDHQALELRVWGPPTLQNVFVFPSYMLQRTGAREWLGQKLVFPESKSCSVMSYPLQPHGLYNPWNSPGQNTGVGSLSLLQQIFPTQESNQGLPHCKQFLFQLSFQGSPIHSLNP